LQFGCGFALYFSVFTSKRFSYFVVVIQNQSFQASQNSSAFEHRHAPPLFESRTRGFCCSINFGNTRHRHTSKNLTGGRVADFRKFTRR